MSKYSNYCYSHSWWQILACFFKNIFYIFDKWVHNRARNYWNVHQIIKLSSIQVKFPLEIWLCQCGLKPLWRDCLCHMLICFITLRGRTQINADDFFLKYPSEPTAQLTQTLPPNSVILFFFIDTSIRFIYLNYGSTNCDVI